MLGFYHKAKSVFKAFRIFYKGSKFVGKTFYRLTKLQRFGSVYLSGVFAFSILVNSPRAYKQHKIYKTINSSDNYGFYQRYREMNILNVK